MKKLFFLFLLLIAAPALAEDQKLKVVATFSILGDLTQQVGGSHIALTTLVDPGADAHVYEPTPDDVKALGAADVLIVNGFGFESWLGKIVASSGYTGPVIVASVGVAPLKMNERNQLINDPHAWQDVANGKIYIANIRDGLIKADSANAESYKKNATKYLAELDKLDDEVKEAMDAIPKKDRRIILSHDAFQYFAHAYGIQCIAPLGMSTESEASAKDIASLIDQVRAQKVHAVFLENMSDPRLMKQLEHDSGATIGGTLYTDALSPKDGPAADYLTMFRHNLQELTRGMTATR